MKNILIRTDSSSSIGLGHVMRDLVLAKEYPNSNIIFATQNLKGNINKKIFESGYDLKILQSNNKKELVLLIKRLKIDLLIIDHYKITYKEEKYIKENSDVKILALDDTYEKHYCDILLNHNLGANPKKYKNLVPSFCKLKCGEKHTLLRDEFHKEKHKIQNTKKSKVKTVFIAMGGVDYNNINIEILKTLSKFKNLKIHIITTSSNNNLKKLKRYTTKIKNIKLHINTTQIAKLMRKSDFAIITPSVTANEAYFMGLPFIAIKTAENQKNLYNYLRRKRYLTLKKFSEKKLQQRVEMMLKVLKNA